mgnify:CR=1 FL=1
MSLAEFKTLLNNPDDDRLGLGLEEEEEEEEGEEEEEAPWLLVVA